MWRYAIALFAATLVTASASSHAQVVPHELVAGPVLARGVVVWAERTPDSLELAIAARRGITRRDITPPNLMDDSGGGWVGSLAASSRYVALSREWIDCEDRGGGIRVCGDARDDLGGPLDGTLASLTGLDYYPSNSVVDVDGARAILSQLRVSEGSDGVHVLGQAIALVDLRSGSKRIVALSHPRGACCQPVRIARRFVGWQTADGFRVYDTVRRAVVYVARPRTRGVPLSFDLQGDGTLVALYARRGALGPAWKHPTLAWFSRAAGWHELHGVRPAPAAYLQYSRPVLRVADNRAVLATVGADGGSELTLVDLIRGRSHAVARLARGTSLGGADFDGRRIAWSTFTMTSVRHFCTWQWCYDVPLGTTAIWLKRTGRSKRRVVMAYRSPYEIR